MGRNHSRLGVWALAVMTCFFIAGAHSAYAANQARVHAGGQYFHNDPANTGGGFSDRVSFGLEGKCPAPNTPCSLKGNFEYFDHVTGVHSHGKTTSLSVNSQPSSTCMGIMLSLGIDMTGRPSAVANGNCPDGSCTNFSIEVIDGDDNAPDQGDWVCNVSVNGRNKMGSFLTETDSAEQLLRGDVEVKTTSEH